MKAKIKYGSWLIVLMIIGLGMLAVFMKHEINKAQKREDRFLKIESRLDSYYQIVSAFVVHINTIYDYLGVTGKIGSVERDTATALSGPVVMDHDPIPPPAGFEALIERSVYQKIERPIKREWDPETKKWEKPNK